MLSEQQIPMFQESVPDTEGKTHPIPFGYDSMLMELQNRSMKAADAMMVILTTAKAVCFF
ncbi:hypothetical protein F4212_03015 [Candidatus Poribacteria bacterium]|nr:hypothetical protein [Candidatus Poribacteria bacterium]